jgi:glyoxylase-like metal-dependent hydrolase (beta-lactamase superfamily II)
MSMKAYHEGDRFPGRVGRTSSLLVVRGWQVGGWTITRVEDPGFELVLPQDDATRVTLQRSQWLHPRFVTDDWSLRIGSSATVVTDGETTVIVDPWLAFDDPSRLEPRLGALAAAGWAADDIDIVVNSHIDGLGANADPATGEPTFPHARYLVPGVEMTALEGGHHAGAEALLDVERAGRLDRYDDRIEPVRGVVLDPLPGHNPGHYGVYVGDPPAAVITGHLFLHPAQIANPDAADLDHDRVTVRATRRALLERCEREQLLVIAPLFASPGAGTIVRDGDRWQLDPAT